MRDSIALSEDALAGVNVEYGVSAPMRDGIRLVADVYRPVGPGPWPLLLLRQPYGRDIASSVVLAHPPWFARRGFMVVVQDVRGHGGSEGIFAPFHQELADGFDTVAWAAALPGSNGRVGLYGFSYQGATQLLAAAGRPPALRAIAPLMAPFDFYSGWFYRFGLLNAAPLLRWACQMLREDARRLGAASEAALDEAWLAPGQLSHALPLREVAPLTHPDLPPYAAEWLRRPKYDDYWSAVDMLRRAGDIALPAFHLTGWHDYFLGASMDGYRRMSALHPNQFLLATPWVHFPWGDQLGGVGFGPAAEPRVDEMLAIWFHHWLDHEAPLGPPPFAGCRYFVLGENAWHEAPHWPPPEAQALTWFLRSGGRANSRFGDGELARAGPGGADDVFNYDPETPVMAPGAFNGEVRFGPCDLADQQQGLNLLVYTSPPLAGPMTVAGSAECHLFVRSSAVETDFIVRVSRVTADGKVWFLTLGAARAKARDGAELRIELNPIAVRFAPSERIRLDVASSAFPLFVRCPNTGADPAAVARPAEFQRALQVVYHDAARPSRLNLPVLPGYN
jgi:putative CocE/NonD family hydrolase